MKTVCFYFQVHQPWRLKTYRFFNMGNDHNYLDDFTNRSIMQKVARECYLPMNALLLNLIKKYDGALRCSFSITGSAVEQFKAYAPEVLESFKRLAETGCVEFLGETYSHSLSSLYSVEEFKQEVKLHSQMLKEEFGVKPTAFRNTELIYSDDIAFRFSNEGWDQWPLTADKFAQWVAAENGDVVNLFMDYETFGEHQKSSTGIFDFMKALPEALLATGEVEFATASEASKKLQPVAVLHCPYAMSWADEERDVTAWLGNDLQNEAFQKLYSLAPRIKKVKNKDFEYVWHFMQNSDHFYYMATKWFSDGDVHSYFNPYDSAYEAFINYMNVLADFEIELNKL